MTNEPTQDQPINVIYIAGWGRSGSTLLARILAQFDGITHLGELRTLWVDGFKHSNLCGCGQPLKQCGVWQAVIGSAFGDIEEIDAKAMTALRRRQEPQSQKLLKLLMLPGQQQKFMTESAAYRTVLATLYRSIHRHHQGATIVDDSLHPGYAYLLNQVANIQLHVVHLVRDPRATAYAWAHRQKQGLGIYQIRDSALGWGLRNTVTELLGWQRSVPYMRVRYEDFVQNPQATVDAVLALAQVTPRNSPFVGAAEVDLGVTHSAFGNSDRFNTGRTPIQFREMWKQQMAPEERRQVTRLTLPLLLRYGYQL
ncbi:MAG: sulfotransferase [Leptolyngbyaceae cyanobacterium]